MDEPLDETYFNWLYSKVASVDVPTPSLTFYNLLSHLHSTEFIFSVQGDDNRASDGLDVRREFYNEVRLEGIDVSWMNVGCSVLEMLIAFSRVAEFETNVAARDWFWVFLHNLGLDECNDANRTFDFAKRVSEVLDQFLYRTYHYNGHGGMFPLRYPEEDQRELELWYQLCRWLVEQETVNL